MHRLAILILAAGLAGPASAEAPDGQFAIKGAGLQTCGAFLDSAKARSEDLPLYAGWIDGYMTAQNQHLPETFDLVPWQTTGTLISLMQSVCAQGGRDMRFIDAVGGLVRTILPQRLTDVSEASGIDMGTSRTVVYNAVVQRVEEALAERELFEGTPDGTFDDATADALARFQRDAGVPVTRLPDQQTLFTLFLKSDAPAE